MKKTPVSPYRNFGKYHTCNINSRFTEIVEIEIFEALMKISFMTKLRAESN
jgi:hypothetical protein